MVDALRYLALVCVFVSIGFMASIVIRVRHRMEVPFCVKLLGCSYVLYAASAGIELQLRLHTDLTWRTPIVLAAAFAGLVAQVIGWAFWQRRCGKLVWVEDEQGDCR